ncbi:IclR family transcriptional regulator [Natrarchaeobius sp. A-rgal3]|uniref:IclR family transcriptional regulator n=1 Tax=Natrarchaeobius versutus TaxID=1679078 RepID=UPI00350FE8DA
MGTQAKNPVKAAETTFEIVNALTELEGAGVTELSAHLELPKSTVHNYLSTLEQEEYVVKTETGYDVGVRFLELGSYARNRRQIYEVAKPEVDRLASRTGERTNLLIEEHGMGVYIHQAAGEQSVKVDASVGARLNLHTTALGKAILSGYTPERVDRIVEQHGLEQVTDRTVGSREELEAELEAIRERGYAIDDEERLDGLRCLGAPVKADDGRVVGAISVSGPVNRMRGEYFDEELPNTLLETTNVIELNLTYS